ncbi:MAG: 2,3-cyclic-nucleotide 2-phosphodiesterase [Gemmatimonadetes bacterium]|nr:2,3-cyclic-nucleotide 2-phosphodiesterase [Gemmatimonadota bacterium]
MSTLFIVALAALAVGLLAGFFGGKAGIQARLRSTKATAEDEAARIRAAAEQQAESLRKAEVLAGKEEAFRAKDEWEREEARRRDEIERVERRLQEREESLDRKFHVLDEKSQAQDQRAEGLGRREKAAEAQVQEVRVRLGEVQHKLESLAGLTADEARRQLMHDIEEEAKAAAAQRVREVKEEARRDADREAKKIISLAIQRIAADHTAETTVSVVALPSDEMKGRIIGREGRNIRAFEQATGIDVIIDDTPEAVVLSGFDPIRRETARIALEKLVSDGRIHPGRIEDVVTKSRKEVENSMREAAEEILYELGIHGVHPEVVKVLGRLKFRTSYGQNQLMHSKEVAILAGNMAAEMGFDATLAKRMGLLHDVGKGMTHEHEGTHVELGWNLAKKYNEPAQVLNAIKAHHDEEPHLYPESFLVTAADAISGSRPGARREMFETYVKRLEKLEEIATSFPGVERCFAIQAGRELRIMVLPDQVSDEGMTRLSEETARRIEAELQYPGQIKVVVIRETRAVDFAR